MSSRLAFSRGWASALLVLAAACVQPAWAADNCNPTARINPKNSTTVPELTNGQSTVVTLDGTGSGPNKPGFQYAWSVVPPTTPAGLSLSFNTSTSAITTFAVPRVAPSGGSIKVRLTVTCEGQTDFVETIVNITDVFQNAPPTASAFISPLNATEGQLVTLDGSASSDPDGDPLTYAWTQIGTPTVTLSNVTTNGAVKSFVAPNLNATTTLTFRLTVSDPSTSSSVDRTVSIVFSNDPPIAALNCPAGGVLTVNEGASVTFSSSGSSDPEGGLLSYLWAQNVGPPPLGIGGRTTPSITFTVPQLGYQQLGGTSITLTVTDPLSASASKTCGLFVNDVTPPVIFVPADITAEATSAAGASVPYSVTSQDAVEDASPGPLACVPASSSVFPLDVSTAVNCTDHDANNNTSNASFKIFVQDKLPPVVTVPGAFGVEATSAQGAIANWVASALDLVDGIIGPDCSYQPGDQFPLGDTTVSCSATDAHHNKSGDQTFIVTVHDTKGPVIAPHDDVVAEATKPQGADVAYTRPSWHDAVDGDGTATCLPASDSTFALGTTAVQCSAKDSHGNESTSSFNVQVKDTTPPSLTLPDDITQEATGPAGASVSFSATASDLVSGNVPVTCIPASGSTFNLAAAPTKAKTTEVDCIATDGAGNHGTAHFNVTVKDTTAPVLTVPVDFKVEATSAAGAAAIFDVSSSDIVDGIIGPDCNHVSGDVLPLGETTVTCSATDTRGNTSESKSFVVTVEDTVPPELTLPSDITNEATGPSGATATFTATAFDLVSGSVPVTCVPSSGSTFGLAAAPIKAKTTTVECSAKDAAGNTGVGSFLVIVRDTTAPSLTVPVDFKVEATSAAGAAATFTVSSSDIVDGIIGPDCNHASGDVLPLGETTITCSATDTRGNTSASKSFVVTVEDTVPPVLTLPSDIIKEATGPSGATAAFTATASDLVSGSVPVTCVPSSGSTFGLAAAPIKAKTTTVECSAKDAAGNTSTGSFHVTVRDTTAPTLAVPASFNVEATGAAGAAAIFTVSSSDIVDGIVGPDCNHASGETFPLGNTTVTCSAMDARGNASASKSFVISVVDTTAPAITPHGDVTVVATANSSAIATWTDPTATDLVDGNVTVTCAKPSGTMFYAADDNTITCSAMDAHNNASSITFKVYVRFAFSGFFSPVDNLPTVNVVNSGQAIPVKFSLGGNQGMAIFASGYPKSAPMSCTGSTQDPVEETVTAGNSSLSYDTGTARYNYVWKTDKAWAGTCRQLQLKFIDGSMQIANFNFKK